MKNCEHCGDDDCNGRCVNPKKGCNPDLIAVPRELFNWLVDYAIELRGVSKWRRGSTVRNNAKMEKLDVDILHAVELRDRQ